MPEFKLKDIRSSECIEDLVITSDYVQNELSKLNIFKSYGPDSIHQKLLKSLSGDYNFVYAVTMLFVKCIVFGTLPKIWKTANETALFKKGSKSDPLNVLFH